jgi:hypothetical protein
MLREGARPEVVRDILGHANVGVTQNVYRKRWWEDWDMTVTKAFKLTEQVSFAAGMNFYNIFNHANFGNPDGDVSSPISGRSCRR